MCQLFLSYRHEIFILGVPGFLKKTWTYLKIPAWRHPKISEDIWSLVKIVKADTTLAFPSSSLRMCIAKCNLTPRALHIVFVSYMSLSLHTVFLKIVSSRAAAPHIFQSGVRIWCVSVSHIEIEVFNPQAWDSPAKACELAGNWSLWKLHLAALIDENSSYPVSTVYCYKLCDIPGIFLSCLVFVVMW